VGAGVGARCGWDAGLSRLGGRGGHPLRPAAAAVARPSRAPPSSAHVGRAYGVEGHEGDAAAAMAVELRHEAHAGVGGVHDNLVGGRRRQVRGEGRGRWGGPQITEGKTQGGGACSGPA
jgi:hypothetical protein